MAVGALFGFGFADGVREVRIKRLTTIARRRERWLLDINAFAVDIPGTEDQSTRGAQRGNLVPLGATVEPQDELVHPNPLGIIRGPVAREVTLEMVHSLFPVRL